METAPASETLRGKSEGEGDGNEASSRKDAAVARPNSPKSRSMAKKNHKLTLARWQSGLRVREQLRMIKALKEDEEDREEAWRKMETLVLVGRREENEELGPSVGEEEFLLKEFMGRPDLNFLEIIKAEDEEATRKALTMMFEEEDGKEARAEAEMMDADHEAYKVSFFRDDWSRRLGSSEDTTELGPMRFTDEPASLLKEIKGWPLNILEIIKAEDEEATRKALMMMFEEEEEKEARAEAEMMESDYEAYKASFFRDDWIAVWSRTHGSFEDTTKHGPMRFTVEPAPGYGAFPMCSLQVFSVKVEGIRRELQWPLDVFGIVAVRDTIDFNRNIIFSRPRENCQTLTKENRNLALEGPTRAVLWMDYLNIEVKLTVKGATESEDKDLSFLVVPFACGNAAYSRQIHRYKTSKLSTLRLTLGHIVRSVEATIFVRLSDGSWPGGFRAQFAAFTTGIRRKGVAGVDHKKIILLDSESRKVPITTGEGEIMLSRRVVSVETTGKLRVCVKAWEGPESVKNAVKGEVFFTPKEANESYGLLDAGFCKMDVTVAWSLIYCHG